MFSNFLKKYLIWHLFITVGVYGTEIELHYLKKYGNLFLIQLNLTYVVNNYVLIKLIKYLIC